jgi:hypothetical protein
VALAVIGHPLFEGLQQRVCSGFSPDSLLILNRETVSEQDVAKIHIIYLDALFKYYFCKSII